MHAKKKEHLLSAPEVTRTRCIKKEFFKNVLLKVSDAEQMCVLYIPMTAYPSFTEAGKGGWGSWATTSSVITAPRASAQYHTQHINVPIPARHMIVDPTMLSTFLSRTDV